MEGSSFSDPAVISLLDSRFVPVRLNVTDDGFPDSIPALEPWHQAWKKNPFYQQAFATSVCIDPGGKMALGTSGAGYTDEIDTAVNYNPPLYAGWLRTALDRFSRYQSLEHASADAREAGLKKITAEVREEEWRAGARQRSRM